MAVYQLDRDLWFPDPHLGEEDGLIAVGGDLSVDRLLLAYSNGFFPWFAFRESSQPHWYCPLQRYVIFPDEIHISHSMRQLLRQQRYQVTFNQDFESVIHACSIANGRYESEGAWLGPDIIDAFTELHWQGFAASIEVWERRNEQEEESAESAAEGRLVGGLYGVTIGRAFFGESMFSLVPNASKLALIHLAHLLRQGGGTMIDCQFETPLFRSMGGRHISYEAYMRLL